MVVWTQPPAVPSRLASRWWGPALSGPGQPGSEIPRRASFQGYRDGLDPEPRSCQEAVLRWEEMGLDLRGKEIFLGGGGCAGEGSASLKQLVQLSSLRPGKPLGSCPPPPPQGQDGS